MVRGALGVRTSVVTTDTAGFELIAPPYGSGCLLREMTISMAAAAVSTFGVGYPAAIGITPTTPVRLLLHNGGDPFIMETKTALAWGTGPTIPGAFFNRVSLPAVIGSNITFYYPQGLYVPAGGSLIVWNLASNGASDITVIVDE